MSEKIIDECIGVYLSVSGWKAIHKIRIKDETGVYWDTQQTGSSVFKTREGAVKDASMWAKDEEIRLEV